MDYGDEGDSYMEHWVNEYWDLNENRWVLADVDGYYEYEHRFGCSQFDLPRRKFVTASEAWIGMRQNTLNKKLDVFTPTALEGLCDYLFMDFHALMNNEIFYSYQPLYLRGGIQALRERELYELDHLAELLSEPDKNMEQTEQLMIDASHVKVHPDAAGARGGNQAMGRTKGGSAPRYIWPWMRMVCRCDSLSLLVPQRIAQLQRS